MKELAEREEGSGIWTHCPRYDCLEGDVAPTFSVAVR